MSQVVDFSKYGLEELYSAKWSILEGRYAIVAMFCLQIYEWIANIRQEVRLIHRAPWASLKLLYLLCRYYPLALWIVIMWAYVGDHSAQTCDHVAHAVHAILAPCQCFSQAVMLMRAYAFTGRDRRVLVLLGTAYISLVGIDIWVFCTRVEIPPPLLYVVLNGTGCFPNYGAGFMGLRIGYSMLAAILMDLLSLVVVVVHCVKSKWERDVSLARYFVSQGLTAFAFVTVINIATAITYFRPPSYHTGIGLPVILIVSNVVACRLILDLREQVTPTDTIIARRHSCIVNQALDMPPGDSWVIRRHTRHT